MLRRLLSRPGNAQNGITVKFDTGKGRSSDHNLTLFDRYSFSALPESRPSQNFSVVSAAVCNSANLAAVAEVVIVSDRPEIALA